ncbi:hypothetical protein XccvBFoX7_gp70c [Xanthomonas phage FoX7]|uniref:Uncharacterized protein n=2 Tax=Carpasinavirus XcP1 TaxID=2182344 RepID=A0A858NQ08_9CAUD|nr:hypothetical protein XccvBFoX6_gp70c [Xanthomonas phage FoX6]QJB22227.1 hypothetical protein XccvBFoX7_gp70c [Xanthomonas phage FoX7]
MDIEYVIPSERWRADVMLLRESLGLNMPDAWSLLKEHGNPDAAYLAFTDKSAKGNQRCPKES